MTNLDMAVRRAVPKVRPDSAIVTSWLLLTLPLLWAAIAIYQLPFAWVGWATYAIVAAMCAELMARIVVYARARLLLRKRFAQV